MFCVSKPAVELWILCADEIQKYKDILQETESHRLIYKTSLSHVCLAIDKS